MSSCKPAARSRSLSTALAGCCRARGNRWSKSLSAAEAPDGDEGGGLHLPVAKSSDPNSSSSSDSVAKPPNARPAARSCEAMARSSRPRKSAVSSSPHRALNSALRDLATWMMASVLRTRPSSAALANSCSSWSRSCCRQCARASRKSASNSMASSAADAIGLGAPMPVPARLGRRVASWAVAAAAGASMVGGPTMSCAPTAAGRRLNGDALRAVAEP
mmetsp:Transcript_164903/g.529289  ORF Transcript_164903/g.529289 Transcript_164903/m.529289 type:complete len:218 (+) Transcript_164903:1411-2064(+)